MSTATLIISTSAFNIVDSSSVSERYLNKDGSISFAFNDCDSTKLPCLIGASSAQRLKDSKIPYDLYSIGYDGDSSDHVRVDYCPNGSESVSITEHNKAGGLLKSYLENLTKSPLEHIYCKGQICLGDVSDTYSLIRVGAVEDGSYEDMYDILAVFQTPSQVEAYCEAVGIQAVYIE